MKCSDEKDPYTIRGSITQRINDWKYGYIQALKDLLKFAPEIKPFIMAMLAERDNPNQEDGE